MVDNDGRRASTEHVFSTDGTGAPLSTSFFSLLLRIPFLTIQLAAFLLCLAPVWLCAVAGFAVRCGVRDAVPTQPVCPRDLTSPAPSIPTTSARALQEQGLPVLGPAPPVVLAQWRHLLKQDTTALRNIVAFCFPCCVKKAATHARRPPTSDQEMGGMPQEKESASDGAESPRPRIAAVLTPGGLGQWIAPVLWWTSLRWQVRPQPLCQRACQPWGAGRECPHHPCLSPPTPPLAASI